MGRCQVGGREVVQGVQAQGGVVGGDGQWRVMESTECLG